MVQQPRARPGRLGFACPAVAGPQDAITLLGSGLLGSLVAEADRPLGANVARFRHWPRSPFMYCQHTRVPGCQICVSWISSPASPVSGWLNYGPTDALGLPMRLGWNVPGSVHTLHCYVRPPALGMRRSPTRNLYIIVCRVTRARGAPVSRTKREAGQISRGALPPSRGKGGIKRHRWAMS